MACFRPRTSLLTGSNHQAVHFDILLCNTYNVYYSPLQMKSKAALIHPASVAELVLFAWALAPATDHRQTV